MTQLNEHYQTLIRLLLPGEIFEYFDIVHFDTVAKEVRVHVDYIAIKPEGYEMTKLISKGFHQAAIIQDFPLREKPCSYMSEGEGGYKNQRAKQLKVIVRVLQKELVLRRNLQLF